MLRKAIVLILLMIEGIYINSQEADKTRRESEIYTYLSLLDLNYSYSGFGIGQIGLSILTMCPKIKYESINDLDSTKNHFPKFLFSGATFVSTTLSQESLTENIISYKLYFDAFGAFDVRRPNLLFSKSDLFFLQIDPISFEYEFENKKIIYTPTFHIGYEMAIFYIDDGLTVGLRSEYATKLRSNSKDYDIEHIFSIQTFICIWGAVRSV